MPRTINQDYRFRLNEHASYQWTPRLTSSEFIRLLANVTALKIRGTYSPQGDLVASCNSIPIMFTTNTHNDDDDDDNNNMKWTQASLPVRDRGLGIRHVTSLALPAFVASAASLSLIHISEPTRPY